jgi:hypothetical protein
MPGVPGIEPTDGFGAWSALDRGNKCRDDSNNR